MTWLCIKPLSDSKATNSSDSLRFAICDSRFAIFSMHVRLANGADLPDITTCFIAAFETDTMSNFLHPYRHDHPESYRKWTLNDRKQQYLAPGGVVVVAETDPEDVGADGRMQIVGSAFWRRWSVDEIALKKQKMEDSYARGMCFQTI